MAVGNDDFLNVSHSSSNAGVGAGLGGGTGFGANRGMKSGAGADVSNPIDARVTTPYAQTSLASEPINAQSYSENMVVQSSDTSTPDSEFVGTTSHTNKRIATRKLLRYIILAILLVIGAVTVALIYPSHKTSSNNSLTSASSISRKYNAQTISLSGIPAFPRTSLNTLGTVSINGDLSISNALVLEPSTKPSEAISGQIYYNAKTHQLSLFNGTNFTQLLTSESGVSGIQAKNVKGSTTSLTLGSASSAGSLILTDGAGLDGIIQLADSTLSQDTVYVLPTVSKDIVQICTSAGNCMPNGTHPGDMLYWNGTKWVTTTVNSSGDILYWNGTKWASTTVTNSGDILYWNGTKWVTLTMPTGDKTYGLLACHGNLVWSGCPPTVATSAVTAIGGSDATSGGSITKDGGADITERGIVYGTSPNPTITDHKVVSTSTGIGSFTTDIHNLDINTTYYVRAYATNTAGTAYGNQVSFTTLNIAKPTVTTNAITNDDTTATTANGGGNVTDGGDAPVTELGLVYSTTQNPTLDNNKVASGSGIGNFTTTITGLTGNTTYYVRAYAINDGGTAYGNQISFSTPTIPTVATASITDITKSSDTAGGNVTDDGKHPVTERGIIYSTSPNPTTADTKISSGTGTGTYTASMTGLREGITYYVRAYATNSVGTGYGNNVSFTTLGQAYAIGDTGPAGGIVFYDKGSFSDGWEYFEAAPAGWSGSSNDPTATWGCQGANISGADGTDIGTGKQDTADIVAGCGTNSIAADVARDYSLNGYTDWFLPSRWELNQIYLQRSVISGLVPDFYWNSSELDSLYSFVQNFSTGGTGKGGKDGAYHIRPIREF